jgi:hypothetical protein
MGHMVSFIQTICVTSQIVSNGNVNIDSSRMKVRNIGIWGMFMFKISLHRVYYSVNNQP